MQKLLSLWKDYLVVEANHEQATVRAYLTDVKDFAYFLDHRYEQLLPGNISKDHITTYLDQLRRFGAASSTVARRFTSISLFLRFLHEEEMIAENPLEGMSAPSTWDRLPEVLSPGQAQELISEPSSSDPCGVRDRALLELLYATGCRVSEAASLRLSFLNLEDRTIRVLGKGRKERVIPFGQTARRWLQRYLNEQRTSYREAAESPYVFLSRKGGGLRRESIWRRVKKYGKRAGLPEKKMYPHILRHSFATHLIQNGANLREVQTLLGHASINTTEIYTHLDMDQIKEHHQTCHPRDEMNVE